MLKENADKISGGDKSKIEKAINEVKDALKGSDTAAMQTSRPPLPASSRVPEEVSGSTWITAGGSAELPACKNSAGLDRKACR